MIRPETLIYFLIQTKMNMATFLRSFLPHEAPVTLAEKLRSGAAGGTAILLLGFALHYLPQHDFPLLILAPMASSAALLYAAPHSTFSQPWNLVGGHLVSALAGWTCSLLIPDPVIAGGLAVGSAIALAYILKCLHPPAAATALVMVLNVAQFHSMGWQWTAWIVLANSGISLLLVLLINNAIPGRHYPIRGGAPVPLQAEPAITEADIEKALAQMDSVIDVSTEDLADIYAKALTQAQLRQKMS